MPFVAYKTLQHCYTPIKFMAQQIQCYVGRLLYLNNVSCPTESMLHFCINDGNELLPCVDHYILILYYIFVDRLILFSWFYNHFHHKQYPLRLFTFSNRILLLVMNSKCNFRLYSKKIISCPPLAPLVQLSLYAFGVLLRSSQKIKI